MNRRNLSMIVAASTLISASGTLQAQSVAAANQLEIGSSGSDQVLNSATNFSAAIGSGNSVGQGASIAIGVNNYISGSYGNVAAGQWNTLDGANCAAAFGLLNFNAGLRSVVIGSHNTIQYDPEWGTAEDSLVVGNANINWSSHASLIVGINNCAGDSYGVWAGSTIGQGLINKWHNATIVGSYNDATGQSPLMFAVGNGIDANNRSNAFEVYADGRIAMPRQGDVLMGEFGNPGD